MSNGGQSGQGDLIEIGALWRQESKDGMKYLRGTMGSKAKLLVFANKYKKEERHPDFLVYVQKKEKDQDQGQGQPQQGASYPNQNQGGPPQGGGQQTPEGGTPEGGWAF